MDPSHLVGKEKSGILGNVDIDNKLPQQPALLPRAKYKQKQQLIYQGRIHQYSKDTLSVDTK